MPKLTFSSDEESDYYDASPSPSPRPEPQPQVEHPLPIPPPPLQQPLPIPPPAPELKQELDTTHLGGKYAPSSPSVTYESPEPLELEPVWPYGDRKFVVRVPEGIDRDSYTVCEVEPSVPRTILSKFVEDGVKFEVEFDDGDAQFLTEFELLKYDNGMNLILANDGNSYDTEEMRTPASTIVIDSDDDVAMEGDDEDQFSSKRLTRKRKSSTTSSNPSLIALDNVPEGFKSRKRPRGRPRDRNSSKVLGLPVEQVESLQGSEEEDDKDSETRNRKKPRRIRNSVNYAMSRGKTPPRGIQDKFKRRWKSLKFVEYPPESRFSTFHMDGCFECGRTVDAKLGTLAKCQCCSRAFHPKCLHDESSVFSVAGQHYLQCIYCLNVHKQISDPMGPRYDVCTYCNETSPAAVRYRNVGGGMVNPMPPWLDRADLLFRCNTCDRGFHFYHLPPPDASNLDESEFDMGDEELSLRRLSQYTKFYNKWNCYDCVQAKEADMKVERIVAWKSVGDFIGETDILKVPEDHRLYGVKYAYTSYAHLEWRPGHWIYSEKILPKEIRDEFIYQIAKYEEPAAELDEVVPPGYLETDVILDAKIERETFMANTLEEAIFKIDQVTSVYVKMKALDYDDIVWEAPPNPNDNHLYPLFKDAFEDYCRGLFTVPPPNIALNTQEAQKTARQNLSVTPIPEQPSYLQFIKLLNFQLTGLTWLYKNWVSDTSCVLADEPGMGKAIQVVSFLAVLKEKHNVWPHLIITTSHGVLDWRRKIAHMAPSLRVATYSGPSESRIPVREHALFHKTDGKLKVHVVITDYDTIHTDASLAVIDWQTVIVDEGHLVVYDEPRSANTVDKFKSAFRVVITGMPITTAPMKLYNIIRYLEGKGASRKDVTFPDITKETRASLDLFQGVRTMRRLKSVFLKPLQTASEYILPVTLTHLQRSQYRQIVRDHAEIVGPAVERKEQHKSRVNGVLKRIRQVLAHPYVFDENSQDDGDDPQDVLDLFLGASQKYQVLALLLPKLKELGHRPVIFTQSSAALDCVEFLVGELQLPYLRVDRNTSALDRQAIVDEFNNPETNISALISTSRHGGVGLNLPTADIVIIVDPDYDSFRDYHAIARAHRIGQGCKVRVFTFMTVDTAEERLLDISLNGAVDPVELSDSFDIEDSHDAGICGPEYLSFGLKAIFETDGPPNPEVYNQETVSALLEKATSVPAAGSENGSTIETALVVRNGVFENFAKACKQRAPQGKIIDAIWQPILQKRLQDILLQRPLNGAGDSDTEDEGKGPILPPDVEPPPGASMVDCILCGKEHALGFCPLKFVKVEICRLCDTAHFAGFTNCPAMRNPNNIKAMIHALQGSQEDPKTKQELVELLEKRKIQLLATGEWWVDGKGGWVEKDKAVAVRGR